MRGLNCLIFYQYKKYGFILKKEEDKLLILNK